MIITIQLQSPEEMAWLQPLLQQLQAVQVEVKVEPPASVSKQGGIEALLAFVADTPFPPIERVEIPPRDDRNER